MGHVEPGSHDDVYAACPGDSRQANRIPTYAGRRNLDDRATSPLLVEAHLIDGCRDVSQQEVVMVPEVVPPDPSEIVETYRFMGPDLLAGCSGRFEDTGDVCQDVFVHHGRAQQVGVHLPPTRSGPAPMVLGSLFPLTGWIQATSHVCEGRLLFAPSVRRCVRPMR